MSGSAGIRLIDPNSTGTGLPFSIFPAYHQYSTCLNGAAVCTGLLPAFAPSLFDTSRSTSCGCSPTSADVVRLTFTYGCAYGVWAERNVGSVAGVEVNTGSLPARSVTGVTWIQ